MVLLLQFFDLYMNNKASTSNKGRLICKIIFQYIELDRKIAYNISKVSSLTRRSCDVR